MSGQEPVRGTDATSSASARQAQIQRLAATQRAEMLQARQILNQGTMEENTENATFNPLAILRNAQPLERRINVKHGDAKQETQKEDGDPEIQSIDGVTQSAEDFQNRNPELEKRALLSLKTFIDIDDSPEEILAKVLKSYPDHFLADEALDFLCETTLASTKVGMNLRRARSLLNESWGREVRAGRNIDTEAKEFAKLGIGSTGNLRDLYRDITGNPREPVSLFEELTEMYTFDKMRTVLKFILHSIGTDLRSKGPSISPVELQRLFTEARTMQAILSVYRFFFQRMRLIQSQFNREDLTVPSRLTFDLLSKLFVKMISERYPSPDKVLKIAAMLGISEEIVAQIIIFTQWRDAMRGVSPRLFKSEKHRQDLLATLMETISELDDLLEEEEDEEEEDKKPPGWSGKDTLS